MTEYLIGIDEAGRGPLAGPLSIAAVFIKDRKTEKLFAGIKDSKQLTEKLREEWFERIIEAEEKELLTHAHVFISHISIDAQGLTYVCRKAIAQILRKLEAPIKETHILLDAGLRAPTGWSQESIIKGDEKVRLIAMASIIAKVKRDRYMIHLAKKYPLYGFEKHKGYGTREHYKALKKHGPSKIHRLTFLKS